MYHIQPFYIGGNRYDIGSNIEYDLIFFGKGYKARE